MIHTDEMYRRFVLPDDPQRDTVSLLRERFGVTRAAARRLASLYDGALVVPGPRLLRPSQVHAECRRLASARQEQLWGFYVNARNECLARHTLSVGSLNCTRTHPREILFPAIETLACGFILAHNHPSGHVDPSDEDLQFTRSVQRAGELLGIELYDHLIVGRQSYCSLRELGSL